MDGWRVSKEKNSNSQFPERLFSGCERRGKFTSQKSRILSEDLKKRILPRVR
jgi:hypothetical protein